MALVNGGDTPDSIIVQHPKPVRLTFRRDETAACSERVVLADFGKRVSLPEGEVVPAAFLTTRPGEYAFTCPKGMLTRHADCQVTRRATASQAARGRRPCAPSARRTDPG